MTNSKRCVCFCDDCRYILSFLTFLVFFAYIFAITATSFWLTYWINEGGQVSASLLYDLWCLRLWRRC